MRIGVVTTSYPADELDCAGRFVAEHVAWLRAQGHDVEVVAAKTSDSGSETSRDSLRVLRVPAAGLFDVGARPPALVSLGAWSRAGLFSARLAALVYRRARCWDAAIAHWLIPCGIALAPLSLPRCAIAHGSDVGMLERWGVLPGFRAVLASSGVEVMAVNRDLAARVGSDRVVAMGVDVARIRATAPEGRQSGEWRVVYVGRLVKAKGVDTLIDAVSLLRRRGTAATLIIAGEGPERAALQALARARAVPCQFRGMVTPTRRNALLRSADVVALPSRGSEGAPVVLREALAAGAAVVASTLASAGELPVVTVPPDNAPALADALMRARPTFVCADALDWSRVGPQLLPAPVRTAASVDANS